ncbi:response regulator/sensor histidine kinase [Corallococcus coralloides DSM 2259]|uniref:histidine kinase n=1 Tax=Corallococcus coralloides (strain ATCC 25202 / DSM 2259 / NBRC 100086 / M2) TaxID=1144275 RepID=H8N1V8_CORCM|nr:ATP-binding protein [Corallococcus coralloides]AFE08235.1 response regulator/sensor histidine kinase [Corallococcus coralloides DSM 2259]
MLEAGARHPADALRYSRSTPNARVNASLKPSVPRTPVLTAVSDLSPRRIHEASDAPRARILLVDDTPSNLLALEAILEPLGQQVVSVRSGDEALKALLLDEYACVLMDVQMPGLDGLETARLVRTRERTKHLPILFVTALSREAAYVTRGYEYGAVDYLLKPVDPDILRAKVSVFVELYLRGEKLRQQALELAERRRVEEELQRATELEQQLVGIVGHDIRTPLAAILTTANAQLSRELLPDAQRKAFERVARGGERIQRIVDQLLDFTRARVGGGIPVVPGAGDLNELCRKLVDELRAAKPERSILCDFARDSLPGVWDLDRLAQVVANLLDNALKYSPRDTPVRLRTYEQGADTVYLEVQNAGAPIPAHLLPTLFQPFRRGDGADQRESLGLGLYIARSIVEAHGGTLRVESTPDVGTIFSLCLPRQALVETRAHSACAGVSEPMTA